MSPSIAAWSPIWIAWRSCSLVRSRHGSLGRVRPITRLPSGSMKASCCAGWIHSIAASDNSFRTRSPHRSERTCTSVCPSRSPMLASPRFRAPSQIDMLVGFRPLRLMLVGINRRSNIYRALVTNPGFAIAHDEQRVYARNLEVPSGGGVGTARAIAHAYGVFASGGRELGLRQETLDLLAAPAIPPTRGFQDECLKGEVQFSLGFMKPSPTWTFGSPALVRVSGVRRLSRLRRSGDGNWIRVRDKSDGDAIHWRPPRCGAQRRALRWPPQFRGRERLLMTIGFRGRSSADPVWPRGPGARLRPSKVRGTASE